MSARHKGQGPAERAAQAVAEARQGSLSDEAFGRLYALALALMGQGHLAEAAELLGALAERRPQDVSTLYYAAAANFNLKRTAEAERFARAASETALAAARGPDITASSARLLHEQAAGALVLLGTIIAVRGDDAGAVRAVAQAAELAPRSFEVQFALGRALYGAGDNAGAARAFRAASGINRDDRRALFFLGTVLERAGDTEGALAAYRELTARFSPWADGHMGLGVLLVKRGGEGVEEGMKALARALEINPDLYEARVTLGRALVARGWAAEAVEHLKRAAALAPDNPEPHYQLSLAYRRLGRAQEAAAESAIVKRIHESRRAKAP